LPPVAIENLYAFHYLNTKHVSLPPGTANTYAYFQDTGLMGHSPAWWVC